MNIDRRDFLKSGAAFSTLALMPTVLRAAPANTFAPAAGPWRTFEITTRIEIPNGGGAVRTWIPLPSVAAEDWIRPLGDRWDANGGDAIVHQTSYSGTKMLAVSWPSEAAAPAVTVTSRVATRDRTVDLTGGRAAAPLSRAERTLFTAATALVPTDGIVRATAEKITAGAVSDLAKARSLYEWIVVNTFRDANTRGCGSGDVAAMLQTGNLGGKCADLNALFVGLARSVGIPAREFYGIRVAPSRFGYKSLGANSEDITKAQHCRAEVYLDDFGWVPMDPADVRKVVLEEPPGNLALSDAKVEAARQTLFGAWETNWIAYNDARDVRLPGAAGPAVGFLMYPQAETAAGRLDCLDASTFRYTISTREIAI